MDLNPAVLLAEPVAFAAGVALLRARIAFVRDRPLAAVGVAAAASAAGAIAAGGSPTGLLPLDLLLVAGLGTVGALAGSVANSRLLLVSALAAALAGVASTALPLALAAVGLVLAGLLLGPDPVVDALAGGLVVQAVLRLDNPDGRGLTAAVAAIVLLPLLVSAARTLEPGRLRLLARIAAGAGAFAVVGAVGGAVAATAAVGPLRRGLSTASAAVTGTGATELEATSARLATAGEDFAEARRSLGAWWALPARAVPVVAQHWRVLHAAAVSGDELAASGRRALSGPALSEVRVVDGRVPLDQLAAIEPRAGEVAARATAARRRLDGARSAWLLPPLSDRLDTELGRVRGVERTTGLVHRALGVLPRLLGRDGPRRYFLAVQTPVEARGGGGFLGNFGEIVTQDGHLRLSRFGRPSELTTAAGREQRVLMAPDDFIDRYARFRPEFSWTNVNLSPDVPTNAAVIAGLYPQSGGAPVDGVITIDPAALTALLHVVGAIEVPSWPTPISAANALQLMLYDQYERYQDSFERIDFLGEVALEAWRRLTTGGLPLMPQVVATLGPAIDDKHLMLFSTRPDEQRLFEDMGAAGGMAPVRGDFMGLVTQNAAGNKIDWFLRRSVDYRVALDPGSGRLNGTATITLRNDAPPGGLPPGLIGNELIPPLPPGNNKLYLSFYTPWELLGARLDGADVGVERATELGRQVYSTAVVIPPRSTVTLELTLAGRMKEDDGYRLDIHRQPMVAPDEVTHTLTLSPGWLTAGGSGEETASRQLVADASIEIPLHRR